MSEQEKKLAGPDFALGMALADIDEGGMILGHVAGDAVLLARRGHELFAIGAECTHYHGPLAEGVLVEDTVRCPWHHACFSLRTGEPLRAPALAVLRRLRERAGDRLVLIAAGGIETPDDAWERLAAGATLVQAYTGFIYGGPLWPRRMHAGLARRARAS